MDCDPPSRRGSHARPGSLTPRGSVGASGGRACRLSRMCSSVQSAAKWSAVGLSRSAGLWCRGGWCQRQLANRKALSGRCSRMPGPGRGCVKTPDRNGNKRSHCPARSRLESFMRLKVSHRRNVSWGRSASTFSHSLGRKRTDGFRTRSGDTGCCRGAWPRRDLTHSRPKGYCVQSPAKWGRADVQIGLSDKICVHHLNASRLHRILWLMGELEQHVP